MPNGTFEIHADIHTVYDVPIAKARLMTHLFAPTVFERYMPGVKAVTDKGDDCYEWQYRIEMPFAEALELAILTKRGQGENCVEFCAANAEAENQMRCSLGFKETDAARTDVELKLSIGVRRKSGSEIHPLAMLFGEGMMSYQMRLKMESIATDFLKNSIAALTQESGSAPAAITAMKAAS